MIPNFAILAYKRTGVLSLLGCRLAEPSQGVFREAGKQRPYSPSPSHHVTYNISPALQLTELHPSHPPAPIFPSWCAQQ